MRLRTVTGLFCVFSLSISISTTRHSAHQLTAIQSPTAPSQKPAEPPQHVAQESPRFALLIGINKYKDPSVPELTASENDVTLLKETLIKDYAFDEKNIRTLRTAEATRDAILGTFRTHLIENAKKSSEQGKDALIIFHFSGHGSRVPDQDEDENDLWDETIVPYDSRTEKGFDIRDDEIDDLFIELSQYSSKVNFIFDSCHSGTASRGDLEARESPSDQRPQPPYKRRFSASSEDRSQKYVTISAALPNQRAYVRPKELATVRYGALTYHLVTALKRASRQTTYRMLMHEVAAAVTNEIPIQNPQVEGDKDRFIFGGAATRAEPFVEIAEVKDGEVVFKAGKVHGVKVGTHVAIYAAEATTYAGKEKWLTNATVTEVRDFVSAARLPSKTQNPKVTEVSRRAKVILASPTFGGGPLPVSLIDSSLRSSSAQAVRTDIRRRLDEGLLISNQLVQWADEAGAITDAGLLRLKQGKFKDVIRQATDLVPAETCINSADELPAGDTEGLYLDDGTGVPLFGLFVRTDDSQAPEKLAKAIANRAKQRNLLSLENTVSSLNNAVKVTLQRESRLLTYICESGRRVQKLQPLSASPPSDRNELPLGAIYHLDIQNTSEEPLFITAILVGNDGGIKVLYPKQGETDPVAGGITVTTRSLGATPPLGRQVVKVIVTSRYTDFSFLETTAVRRSSGSPLERLLSQSGIKSRDGLPPDAPHQWGVVSFDFVVTDKEKTPAVAGMTTLEVTVK